MSVARRAIEGFGAVLGADVLRLISMGALILLLTRVLLTPEEYGLLFLAMAILNVAALFSRLGLDKSAARYLAEYQHRDPIQVPHILRTTVLALIVTIIVVATLLVSASGLIAATIGDPNLAPLLVVGTAFVAGQTLSSMCVTTFQGFNRVRWGALMRVIESILTPVAIVAFVLLGFGVVGVLLGYIVGVAVVAVFGLVIIYFRFYRRYDRSGSPEPGLKRRLLEYSVPLTATRGANVLDKRVDIIMVGYFLDPLAVAYYNLAKQISEFGITPAGSLGFTLSPAYGELKASEQLSQAGRVYERSFVYTLALYLPAATGLALVADPLVRFVFGNGYRGAIPVVQLFSLYVLLIALDKITNDGLDFLGRARVRALAKGGSSVANFSLNLVLIPLFGIVGAAVATLVTTSLLVAVELVVVSSELPIRVGWVAKRVVLVGGVTAGMGALVLLLIPYVSDLVSLLGVVLLGAAVWIVLVTASGVVEPKRVRALL